MIPERFLDIEDDYVHNSSDSTARSAWKEGDLDQNPRKLMDYNFYRKVSKYDLDKLCVDWSEYQKERERQNTVNAAYKKEN